MRWQRHTFHTHTHTQCMNSTLQPSMERLQSGGETPERHSSPGLRKLQCDAPLSQPTEGEAGEDIKKDRQAKFVKSESLMSLKCLNKTKCKAEMQISSKVIFQMTVETRNSNRAVTQKGSFAQRGPSTRSAKFISQALLPHKPRHIKPQCVKSKTRRASSRHMPAVEMNSGHFHM